TGSAGRRPGTPPPSARTGTAAGRAPGGGARFRADRTGPALWRSRRRRSAEWPWNSPLGNHDHVTGLQRDVVLAAVVLHDAVVVERDLVRRPAAVLAEDHDLAGRREVAEPAGQRDGLEHRGVGLELEHAGLLHLAEDGDAIALHLDHRHRDLGVRHELAE